MPIAFCAKKDACKMPRISTQVSKAHPGIKKILSALPDWGGRTVYVVQVDPGWTFSLYNDSSEPYVYQVGNISNPLTVHRVSKPLYGGPATLVTAPSDGEIVVTRDIGPYGTVTIFVPALDQSALEVARDALLEGDKRRSAQVLRELGPYAGIGSAIVGAQGAVLEKASSGKTSKQIAREVVEILKLNRTR